jgi:hypothetical protein
MKLLFLIILIILIVHINATTIKIPYDKWYIKNTTYPCIKIVVNSGEQSYFSMYMVNEYIHKEFTLKSNKDLLILNDLFLNACIEKTTCSVEVKNAIGINYIYIINENIIMRGIYDYYLSNCKVYNLIMQVILYISITVTICSLFTMIFIICCVIISNTYMKCHTYKRIR